MNAPGVATSVEHEAVQEPKQPHNLGSMIDRLYELNVRKRELAAEQKVLGEQIEELEKVVLEGLDQQGLRLGRGRLASVSVSESAVPQIEDWDKAVQYMKDNDAFHLLERRVAIAGWRELHEAGETVPGTVPFTKRKASVRKI